MVKMHAPSPTKAIVRTPAGRSDEDLSSPINAPEQAAYSIRKASSNSALVGSKLNVPRARDWLVNGMTAGDIPRAAAAGTVDTARAEGENAGPKTRIPASIIEVRRRLDPFLCNSLDAHRKGVGFFCVNHERNGLETCRAPTIWVDVRRVLDCEMYVSTPKTFAFLFAMNLDDNPMFFIGLIARRVPNLVDVSPHASPESRTSTAARR